MSNTSSSTDPWTPAERDALEAATVITCCFSVVGTFFIVLSYLLWKDLRATSRKLLVYLSIADFVTALGNMLGVIIKEGGTGCEIQSAFTTFSSLSSFFWTVSIAVYLYFSIARESQRLAERSIPVLHVVSWIVPALIVSAALGFGVLGSDESSSTTVGWCWVKSGASAELFWKLFTGKGWEIAAYVLVPVLYFFVKQKIRSELSNAERIHLVSRRSVQVAQDADRKMTLIPIVFVLVRSWGTARFLISEITSPQEADIFWLTLLQAIGDSSQGAANFILFCLLTKKIRRKFVEAIWSSGSRRRARRASASYAGGDSDKTSAYHTQSPSGESVANGSTNNYYSSSTEASDGASTGIAISPASYGYSVGAPDSSLTSSASPTIVYSPSLTSATSLPAMKGASRGPPVLQERLRNNSLASTRSGPESNQQSQSQRRGTGASRSHHQHQHQHQHQQQAVNSTYDDYDDDSDSGSVYRSRTDLEADESDSGAEEIDVS